MIKKWVLLVLTLSFVLSLQGQCPGNDSIIHFARYSQLPPDEKLNTLLRLREVIKNCPVDDSTQAILLNFLGTVNAAKGDYFEGIRYYNEAIAFVTKKERSKTINPGYLSNCYYNLSNVYESLQNRKESNRALDSCVKIGTRYNVFNVQFIYALKRRAEYLYNIGDFKNCYAYADMAQRLAIVYAKTYPADSMRGIQLSQSSAGHKINALLALKEYESAMQVARAQLTHNNLYGYFGTIYGQMADIELVKKRYPIAQLYLDTALRYEKKFGSVANCKVILNNMGILRSLKLNKIEARIPYYIKSYRYKNDTVKAEFGDTVETVNALSNLGIAYGKLHNFDSAYYYFNMAFEYVGSGWNETRFLNTLAESNEGFSKLNYLLKLLVGKADTYISKYKVAHSSQDLSEAIRMYTVIDKLLFKIKTEQSSLISKLALRENFHSMYENAIEACELSQDFESAFHFMERSKAILLIDQLTEERWTAQYDFQKQNQLKKQILLLTRQLDSLSESSPAYDSLNKVMFRKREELETISAQIKTNNPLFYQYSVDTSSLKAKDIQTNLLHDHNAFFEMFSGDSAVYALMITRNATQLKKINKIAFDSLSKLFNSCVSNSEATINSFQYCTSISLQLYHLVFDKLSLPQGRLIISPDGQYFPYEALVTAQRTNLPIYFIEDHAVSYAYSARYLMLSFQKNTTESEKNFMGMAPVRFASHLQLADLRGSDASIKRLTSDFSSADSYLNKEATRNLFLQNFHRYKLIQLYTHAADSGYYKEPVIYFADSPLMLSDLLYEHIPATQLIVLSGCETGSGKLYQGEGVFSFNRGFAAIGIPSCIANLWQVENTSTYQITELFHKNISKGMPLDLALQEAKKEFIKTSPLEKQLPYYWAAPILTGRTDAIEFQRYNTWKYLLSGIVLLGLTLVGIQLWRRKSITKSL